MKERVTDSRCYDTHVRFYHILTTFPGGSLLSTFTTILESRGLYGPLMTAFDAPGLCSIGLGFGSLRVAWFLGPPRIGSGSLERQQHIPSIIHYSLTASTHNWCFRRTNQHRWGLIWSMRWLLFVQDLLCGIDSSTLSQGDMQPLNLGRMGTGYSRQLPPPGVRMARLTPPKSLVDRFMRTQMVNIKYKTCWSLCGISVWASWVPFKS